MDLYGGPVDELVTGEAVTLDLPPAPLGLRVAGALVDVVVAVVLLILGFLLTDLLATSDALASVGAVVTIVGVLIALPTAVETLTRGRSLGKLATGLRVVRDDAGPITFHHAFVRALVGMVECWAFTWVPAFICALVNRKGKRVGDLVAGTYVVRNRVSLQLPPPPPMPPPLAAWARRADIAPLPERLVLSARQVVGRYEALAPQTRDALARRLADEMLNHVAPPPPPGTPPDAFLLAVLAEHRERDLARIRREQALVGRLTASAHRRR